MNVREQINWYLDKIEHDLGEKALRWVLAFLNRLYVSDGRYRG